GPHDPRRAPVPGHLRLDAALHRERGGHQLPAALLRTGLPSGPVAVSGPLVPLRGGARAVLTDIEGTTTPLSFVHDVLFPYARRRLDAACASGEERFVEALGLLRAEYQAEKGSLAGFGDGAPYVHALMDRDRKSTGLKLLQGLLWEDGYRSGELKGQVYADVAEALRAWKERGIRVRVFSSGSVLAQELIFGHSDQGDLLPYFEGFHDTT